MIKSNAIHPLFVCLFTLVSARSVYCAPSKEQPPLAPLMKWIPKDTIATLIVNVKELKARDAHTRIHRKQLERVVLNGLLEENLVRPLWMGDPTAESIPVYINRVVALLVPKPAVNGKEDGESWLTLLQGEFDEQSLESRAEKLGRDEEGEQRVRIDKVGGKTVYEGTGDLGRRFYYCLLNSEIMIVTTQKMRVEEAIKNIRREKETGPSNPRIKKWLEKSSCCDPIEAFIGKDYVVERNETSHVVDGTRVEEVHSLHLGDFGVETIEASAAIHQHLTLKVRVLHDTEDTSKKNAQAIKDKLAHAHENLRNDLKDVKVTPSVKELKWLIKGLTETAVLSRFLKTTTVATDAETLSIEMEGTPGSVWLGVVCFLLH
jgi:hypothetical protein